MTQPRRYRAHQAFGWLLLHVVHLVALSCPAGAQVYVANSLSGTVSVISTPSNTVVATIPVGTLPQRVAITPNGQFVYVTNHNSGTMSKIDTASNIVVATIPVGSLPEGVAVSPDGNSVFVVVGGSLNRFSVATNAQMGTFSLPSGIPVDAVITPDGQLAYVVDRNQNVCSLYPVNLASGAILNHSTDCPGGVGAKAGSFPRSLAVRPDGQFVYVTAFQDGALQVVRVSDNHYVGGGCVSASGCTAGGPVGVAISSDNKFAFTANLNENNVAIFALSATSGLPLAPPSHVLLPSSPSYLGVTPDSRFLYVAHGSNSVSVIDLKASPPSIVQAITVGIGPQGIAVSPPSPPPPPVPAALSASLGATPATVTVGQSITVTMTVGNTGGSAATSVSAQSSLSVNGGGGVAQTSGPSPGPTTVGAGSSQAFTYTYSASAAGNVTFMGSASGGGVSSNNATSNAVTIQSAPSPPTLSATPGSLSFMGELGLADPAPQLIQIANSGGGTLAWSVTPSIIGDGNWLSANPTTGSAPPPASVSVAASTCGLPSAVYNGSVVVAATGVNGSPKSIPVTLTVTAPATTPASPQARVCADRPTYRTGDTLRLSVSLRQGTSSNQGDAYLFAPVPGAPGTTTFVSLVLSGGLIVPQLGPTLVPLGRNFKVSDFAGRILERSFDGSEPPGTYVIKAILAVPDTDPTVAANQIAVAVGSFTFAP